MKEELKLKKIETQELDEVKELVVHSKNSTHKILYAGFSVLAIQNQQFSEENKKLNLQLKSLQEQFQVGFDELQIMKKEREEKARRKVAYINRKRLPQRDPTIRESINL